MVPLQDRCASCPIQVPRRCARPGFDRLAARVLAWGLRNRTPPMGVHHPLRLRRLRRIGRRRPVIGGSPLRSVIDSSGSTGYPLATENRWLGLYLGVWPLTGGPLWALIPQPAREALAHAELDARHSSHGDEERERRSYEGARQNRLASRGGQGSKAGEEPSGVAMGRVRRSGTCVARRSPDAEAARNGPRRLGGRCLQVDLKDRGACRYKHGHHPCAEDSPGNAKAGGQEGGPGRSQARRDNAHRFDDGSSSFVSLGCHKLHPPPSIDQDQPRPQAA